MNPLNIFNLHQRPNARMVAGVVTSQFRIEEETLAAFLQFDEMKPALGQHASQAWHEVARHKSPLGRVQWAARLMVAAGKLPTASGLLTTGKILMQNNLDSALLESPHAVMGAVLRVAQPHEFSFRASDDKTRQAKLIARWAMETIGNYARQTTDPDTTFHQHLLPALKILAAYGHSETNGHYFQDGLKIATELCGKLAGPGALIAAAELMRFPNADMTYLAQLARVNLDQIAPRPLAVASPAGPVPA